MYVNVNLEILETEIEKCDNQLEDFSKEVLKLQKIIEDMNDIWKESDYENFATKLHGFIENLNDLKNQIDSYNNFIKGYIQVEKTMDEEYRNKRIPLK